MPRSLRRAAKSERSGVMKRWQPALCVGLCAIALIGCATQQVVQREYYPPDETTIQVRNDGMRIGALKSETIKSGSPDWSGNKSFSLFSWREKEIF